MKNSSKVIEFPLNSSTKTNVTITKKRMKNIRLSVSKAGKVAVSMPHSVSFSYAYEFLVRKRDWICSQLSRINLNLDKNACHFVNNGNIFLLGNNYPLHIQLSTKNKVIFNQSYSIQNIPNNTLNPHTTPPNNINLGIIIYTKDLNPEYIKQIFLKWCKNYFLNFFTNRLNFIYHQMFKNGTPPSIKIKTMKSMWGNCNFVRNVVTLNLYLAKARIECIDYVITHELAHLVHHNHSKEFHSLMTTLLPDWKVRKKLLSNCSLTF